MDKKIILTNEHDYQQVQAELNAQKKPSKLLKQMMQALENYRQARKYGWSRPWNKYGVVNFQSFKLNDDDHDLRHLTAKLIAAQWPHRPEEARRFIDGLLNADSAPMGYLFYQEFTDNGSHYEGVVVSYGRINAENRRFRDRLDVILESPITDGVSTGLSRLRIYADPYRSTNKQPLWQDTVDQPCDPLCQPLFAQLAARSWAWAQDSQRVWNHWITDYIDYFGPRQWPMQRSFFFVQDHPEARIPVVDDALDRHKE